MAFTLSTNSGGSRSIHLGRSEGVSLDAALLLGLPPDGGTALGPMFEFCPGPLAEPLPCFDDPSAPEPPVFEPMGPLEDPISGEDESPLLGVLLVEAPDEPDPDPGQAPDPVPVPVPVPAPGPAPLA